MGADGTVDPGFAAEPICVSGSPDHLDVTADRIYLGGRGFVVRLRLDDGALDDAFGDGGMVRDVYFLRMLATGAGLVLLGTDASDAYTNWVVERLRADGAPDAAFGEDGQRELPQAPGFRGAALGEAPDDSLIVATTIVDGSSHEVAVTRLTPGGDIDAAYGPDGIELEPSDSLADIAVLPDRGAVLSLRLDRDSEPRLGLARLTASGQLDTGYGDGGRVSAAFDFVGPPMTIDSADTTGTSATFTFSTTEPDATFECRVADPTEPSPEPDHLMRPCGSGVHFEGLAEGERLFLVRALDRRGNPGPVVYWTWKANASPPETTLTAAPPLQDRQTVTRFELHATEPSRFACTLDGVPIVISFAPCGPVVTVSVGPGEHVFTAQAIDHLGAADPTPVVYRWSVDLDAPDTRIDAGPPPTTAARSAALSFSSSDPAAGFECRTDGAAWASCSSPHHLDGVAAGVHDFQVRAVDPAGNRDASGAARVWRVEEPSAPGPGGPLLRISATDRALHRAGGPHAVLQRLRIHNGVGRRGTVRLCATYPNGWRTSTRGRSRRVCLRRPIGAGSDTTFVLRGRPPHRPRTGTLRYSVAFPGIATQPGTARWSARR